MLVLLQLLLLLLQLQLGDCLRLLLRLFALLGLLGEPGERKGGKPRDESQCVGAPEVGRRVVACVSLCAAQVAAGAAGRKRGPLSQELEL